jgi:hypothetical protein
MIVRLPPASTGSKVWFSKKIKPQHINTAAIIIPNQNSAV